MNVIHRSLLINHFKSIPKKLASKYSRHNAFAYSSAYNRATFCYSTKSSDYSDNLKNNKVADLTAESDAIDLSKSRKEKYDHFIEPTKYFTPDMTDQKNFEEKFWMAYNEKIKKEKEDMEIEYPDQIRYKKVYHDPIERTLGILRDDIVEFFQKLKSNPIGQIRNMTSDNRLPHQEQIFPGYCDVLIIGGGIVGTSVAFHLQEKTKKRLKVVVLEKDLTYSKASTVLSVGGIRQQFSTPENIELSRYGMDFLQQIDTRLAIDGQPTPNVDLTFSGYLTLASEEGYHQLKENYELQKAHRCHVEMLTKNQLKFKFPWLNVEGVDAGVYGVQREGWFDPWSFLLAMNRKTKSLGTQFLNGTIIGCNARVCRDAINDNDQALEERQIKTVQVEIPNGETRDIHCSQVVITSGAWSKEVGLKFGIGTAASGYNSIPIPVEPRKRYVYCVKSPDGPLLNCPLVIDTTGAYFRREGLADLYLCGRAPTAEEEPSNEDLSVDYDFFENRVWPEIANRCPSFENLKVHSAWGGYYDYNTFDQNAIIGRHPMFANLFIGTGFSGHGIQQAAGAGCAISELILDAELKTLQIQNLGFERIVTFNPILEKCCY